ESKSGPVDRGRTFCQHIYPRQPEEKHRNKGQTQRNFSASDMEVKWHSPALSIWCRETEYHHGERFHRKAPYDAKGVRFAQQIDIAAANEDSRNLEQDNQID